MADLCTLADVKAQLNYQGADRDALISALIPAASDLIIGDAGREFVGPGATPVAREYRRDIGRGTLVLSPYDLQSLTSLTIGEVGEEVTMTEGTDFYLKPAPSLDGVYTWVEFLHDSHNYGPLYGYGYGYGSAYGYGFGYGWANHMQRQPRVVITGTWGFPAVPEEVKRAAVVTVASWIDRAVAQYGGAMVSDQGVVAPQQMATYGLPWASKALYARFKRDRVS